MINYRSLRAWFAWGALSSVPVMIEVAKVRHMDALGCPPAGDCYVPGSESLIYWDVAALAIAAIVWPLALWFTVLFRARKWQPRRDAPQDAGDVD